MEERGDATTTAARSLPVEAAERGAVLLRSLSDPLRLRIVSAVVTSADGELSAGEIATVGHVSGPTVSHHLRVLREAGVLVGERHGTSIVYRLSPTMGDLVPALRALTVDDHHLHPVRGPATGATLDAAGIDAALGTIADELARGVPLSWTSEVLGLVRDSYTTLTRSGTSNVLDRTERFARQRVTDLVTARVAADPVARPPQVLFVCVANAGRSQLAAALMQRHVGDAVVVRSAGSTPAAGVHGVVEPLLTEILGPGADPPFPKPLTDDALRAADVVITMGCGDSCPVLPGVRYEDWAVGDPALASPAGARAIRDDIDRRVRRLAAEILPRPPDGSPAVVSHDVPPGRRPNPTQEQS